MIFALFCWARSESYAAGRVNWLAMQDWESHFCATAAVLEPDDHDHNDIFNNFERFLDRLIVVSTNQPRSDEVPCFFIGPSDEDQDGIIETLR